MSAYTFTEIEKKWREIWENNQVYKVTENTNKPKYYVLDMFPYPSGAGLHVGHPLGYIASDVVARFKRLKGFNVLHPIGFDAFGLPAEQYAIETGQHPAITTDKNIERYKEQLKNIGFSYDWDREVRTCDPQYYKWTQWIFLKLYNSWFNPTINKAEDIENLVGLYKNGKENQVGKPWDELSKSEQQKELTQHRLAYKDESVINWCEALGTVLANDEVVNGVSERGGYPVERKRMSQWFLRITKYADRLLEGLETVDFPDSLKEMQKNWIGKSEGAEIVFFLITDSSNDLTNDSSNDLTKDSSNDLTPSPSPKEERGADSSNDLTKDSSNDLTNDSSNDLTPSPSPKEERGADSNQIQNINFDGTRYFNIDKNSIPNARENRRNNTDAENLLWQNLRNGKQGVKFRRQYPIENFIADFASLAPKLIIEVDGGYHLENNQIEYDKARTNRLIDFGFEVLRFSNEEVLEKIDEVLEKIKTAIEQKRLSWETKLSNTKNYIEANASLSSLAEGRSVRVFTTRPDTIFGVSFMVLAPEHPLVYEITSDEQKKSVTDYINYCKSRTELERKSETKEITGAFTGAYVSHPFTGKAIPIYIAEYVLMGYGTGAIMAVPCGDSRDHAFALKFGIPIPNIFEGIDVAVKAYEEKGGRITNSSCDWFTLDGLNISEAKQHAIEEIENLEIGIKQINYRMRDAGYSRQRYWGEPFPIAYNNEIEVTDALETLPITLPNVVSYKPSGDGKSPISAIPDWVNLPNGNIRETDTMPGYAGSSWYYLRYMDPNNPDVFCDKQKSDYWQQVDLYIGGAEHAVGHLLYSRMWCKVLHDLGYISFDEPFKKLLNQGMIGGIVYHFQYDQTSKKIYSHSLKVDQTDLFQFKVPNEYVSDDESFSNEGIDAFCNEFTQFKGFEFVMDNGIFTFEKAITKMSKRLRNVVNPDEIIAKYGADTFRMYEMFLGPIDQDKPWNTKGIDGVSRFIKRFWSYCIDDSGTILLNNEPANEASLKIINRTLKKIAEDIEKYSFNTCVSSFMICLNELQAQACRNREVFEKFLVMLSPFAPHIAEELWQRIGNTSTILDTAYPTVDEKYLTDDTFNYPISINGKTRIILQFALDADPVEIEKTVLADATVIKWIEGKPLKKFILVKGRIVNVVV